MMVKEHCCDETNSIDSFPYLGDRDKQITYTPAEVFNLFQLFMWTGSSTVSLEYTDLILTLMGFQVY